MVFKCVRGGQLSQKLLPTDVDDERSDELIIDGYYNLRQKRNAQPSQNADTQMSLAAQDSISIQSSLLEVMNLTQVLCALLSFDTDCCAMTCHHNRVAWMFSCARVTHCDVCVLPKQHFALCSISTMSCAKKQNGRTVERGEEEQHDREEEAICMANAIGCSQEQGRPACRLRERLTMKMVVVTTGWPIRN